jgi:predicted GNAT family acetyltransferase
VSDETEVTDDVAGEHFTLTEDGHTAELVYHLNGKRLVLIHTEVPDELEGRGIGGRLVKAALARARREGLTIVPNCPFARSWLERHRDAAEGIDIAW